MTRLQILCKVHGQQGGTIWDFNHDYGVDFLELSNKDFFKVVLAKCLEYNYSANPSKYAFGLDKLGDVVDRLFASVDNMRFDKNSDSFKQACKLLGIKHTYKAIKEYLAV